MEKVVTAEPVAVDMPKDATILHVACQEDVPCLWALVDPETDRYERRLFDVISTGDEVPDGQYLGTVFQREGVYVWHVLEVPDEG